MSYGVCSGADARFSHLSLPQHSGSWLMPGNAAAAHESAVNPHGSVLQGDDTMPSAAALTDSRHAQKAVQRPTLTSSEARHT